MDSYVRVKKERQDEEIQENEVRRRCLFHHQQLGHMLQAAEITDCKLIWTASSSLLQGALH